MAAPRSSGKSAAKPVQELVVDSLYNYPKYYELIFGSDWKDEYHFLLDCFAQHGRRQLQKIFEPACGTGRLLFRLGVKGFEVSGLDLNAHAVEYCNQRLQKQGLPASVFVGDMCDFRLKEPVDLAFNMINSFRHLSSEAQALAHLRCTAKALGTGGLYLLGLHLTPTRGVPTSEENWTARRGQLSVRSDLQTVRLDRRRRQEHLHMQFDITTPSKRLRLAEDLVFRTYTWAQMRKLLDEVSELELCETYDFRYDLSQPVVIDPETEDVVFVLRKK